MEFISISNREFLKDNTIKFRLNSDLDLKNELYIKYNDYFWILINPTLILKDPVKVKNRFYWKVGPNNFTIKIIPGQFEYTIKFEKLIASNRKNIDNPIDNWFTNKRDDKIDKILE